MSNGEFMAWAVFCGVTAFVLAILLTRLSNWLEDE